MDIDPEYCLSKGQLRTTKNKAVTGRWNCAETALREQKKTVPLKRLSEGKYFHLSRLNGKSYG